MIANPIAPFEAVMNVLPFYNSADAFDVAAARIEYSSLRNSLPTWVWTVDSTTTHRQALLFIIMYVAEDGSKPQEW